MKCIFCGKPLERAEHWVAGNPAGPVCYSKRFGKKVLSVVNRVIQSNQHGLFDVDSKDTENVELNLNPGTAD